jgi:16S rRNA (adenine1518-N6/adenine1519-N6)-dimethyltransferase
VHGQSPSDPRARLRALGLRPRKRLSQSFLNDARVAAAIMRAAQLDPPTEVLEVGPGLGVMTSLLAKRARRVVAVEIDPALAEALRTQLDANNVCVVEQDVLEFDPATHFQQPYTVVANLPYHITSPALRHLLAAGPPFAQRLVLMVQAEVAERIVAQPGEMSALAVAIQAQARVSLVRRVPASAFYPRPKVDSAVLRLDPVCNADRALRRDEIAAFTTLVQAGFKQPRKTLANSLAEGLGIPRPAAIEQLGRAQVDPALRPQALRVEDWIRLFRAS